MAESTIKSAFMGAWHGSHILMALSVLGGAIALASAGGFGPVAAKFVSDYWAMMTSGLPGLWGGEVVSAHGASAAGHGASAGAGLAGGFDVAAGCTQEGFNNFIMENQEMGMLGTLAAENSGDLISAYETGGYCHDGHT